MHERRALSHQSASAMRLSRSFPTYEYFPLGTQPVVSTTDGQVMDQTEWFFSKIGAQTKYKMGDARHARGCGCGQQGQVAGGNAVAHLHGGL